MGMFMETTQISEHRTIGQIQQILSINGANQILIEYDSPGKVGAISFKIEINDTTIPFRLPCRWPSIESILREGRKRPKYKDTYEDWARRVAWRQILRWVEAQMALVETNMVKVYEVFLPYAQAQNGKTLFEQLEGTKFKMLSMK